MASTFSTHDANNFEELGALQDVTGSVECLSGRGLPSASSSSTGRPSRTISTGPGGHECWMLPDNEYEFDRIWS